MKIDCVPIDELSADLLSVWSDIQLRSEACSSPYSRPEYSLLMSEVGRPVQVAVLELGDRPVGFFPFEKSATAIGSAVGLKLNDYQAVVAEPWAQFSPDHLLESCGLRRFQYENLVDWQGQFHSTDCISAPAPGIVLTDGFANYRNELKQRGEKELEKTFKKLERMRRDHASVEFTMHDERTDVLPALVRWKMDQYERTNALNPMKHDWVMQFLRRLCHTSNEHFSGVLSTLRLDGEIVAAHLGMRTRTVMHHWFPAHDIAHRAVKQSPGLVLMALMMESLAGDGIARIDLGKGIYSYKQSFANTQSRVLEGSYGRPAALSKLAKCFRRASRWIRQTAETAGLHAPVKWYRQFRNWAVMR